MDSKTLLILGGMGLVGFIIWKKMTPVGGTTTVNPLPTGASANTPSWADQLSQLLGKGGGGSVGGSPTDAQQAAGIIGALGQFANGIGSVVKGIGEWQSNSSDSVST